MGMIRSFGSGDRQISLVGSPIEFSSTTAAQDLAPPLVGEHTFVLLETAGYSPKQIDGLKERNVI